MELKPTTTHGVVILALGHTSYVEKAFNLAISIRVTSPTTRIALVHSNNIQDLRPEQRYFFNKLIECPPEYYMYLGAECYVQAKLYLDKLTPFKQTLFLDADTIMSPYKSLDAVFTELSGQEYVMICRGDNSNTSDWVDVEQVKSAYNLDKYYDCSSEFMYFEKTTIFKRAREINKDFSEGKVWYRKFANGIPDEPPLTIAMIEKLGQPYRVPYKPTYWDVVDKYKKSEEIWNNYVLLSMGGRYNSKITTSLYNNIIKWYGDKLGVSTFTHKQKQETLRERRTI